MQRKSLLSLAIILLLAGTLLVSGCTKTSPGTTTTAVGVGCDSRAIAMALPGTVNDQMSSGYQPNKVYCIYVPAGTSTLTVTLSDLVVDFDLYIGYGSYSSIEGDNYDWSSDNLGTATDSITISSPQAGNYYIQVTSYEQVGGTFRLQASTGGVVATTTIVVGGTCDSRAISMSFPGTVNDQVTSVTQFKVYCMYVPAGRSSLTVTLSNLQADLDLYMGYGSYSSVEGDNYDWSSDNSGTATDSITISSPQAGNYYIQVYNGPDTSSTFRLQVA